MKKKRIRRPVIKSLAAGALLLLGFKGYQYASAPTKPKECDFIYPERAEQTTPANIRLFSVPENVPLRQTGGTANDASCLNKTAVYGIATISSEDDIRNALAFARDNGLKVTSAGQQHSMGGQSFVRGGLVLDMKGFKGMTLDKAQSVLTVQSGAVWADVQQLLDTEGLSVKAMQSINIFTVGGTLSVNAHGIAHDPGPIAPTVRSLHVMTPDGKLVTASPAENPHLFRHVLGGYGLFGVIVDADLDVVPNATYAWTREQMDYRDFPAYYEKNIKGNPAIGLFYGRISVSPSSYLMETVAHVYTKIDDRENPPPLAFPKHTWINRLVFNASKTGAAGRYVRWILEKYVEPRLHICSRNEAMSQKEVCLVSRNQEMYDSMGYLKNKLRDTDILQEYFIPKANMPAFIDGLRATIKEDRANLLNVTIRIVSKDTVTSLPYAKEDMFAFVLYFNQKLNEKDSKTLRKTTVDLINVAEKAGGTYYLPYQLYYSSEQLRTAYPEIDGFFAAKKQYDPSELFTNMFYEKYSK